jgi:hypothetical protein
MGERVMRSGDPPSAAKMPLLSVVSFQFVLAAGPLVCLRVLPHHAVVFDPTGGCQRQPSAA